MNATAALARAYSDTLAAERPDTFECARRAADIAAHMRRVWLRGSSERIETCSGSQPLASIVSYDLCDMRDNVLHDLIALVRKCALAGDADALAIIDRMCQQHAAETVELTQ